MEDKPCWNYNCYNKGSLCCSGCKIAYYCSNECQQRHWFSKHKSTCKILKNVDRSDSHMAKDLSFLSEAAPLYGTNNDMDFTTSFRKI